MKEYAMHSARRTLASSSSLLVHRCSTTLALTVAIDKLQSDPAEMQMQMKFAGEFLEKQNTEHQMPRPSGHNTRI